MTELVSVESRGGKIGRHGEVRFLFDLDTLAVSRDWSFLNDQHLCRAKEIMEEICTGAANRFMAGVTDEFSVAVTYEDAAAKVMFGGPMCEVSVDGVPLALVLASLDQTTKSDVGMLEVYMNYHVSSALDSYHGWKAWLGIFGRR